MEQIKKRKKAKKRDDSHTRIKLCGLRRREDIETANELMPDMIGFVFAKKSKRCVTAHEAKELKKLLSPEIRAVGVFVNEDPSVVAGLLNDGTLDLAQLHGSEDEDYIRKLRLLTDQPLIQAFSIRSKEDAEKAGRSSADLLLLDTGEGGTGRTFDWSLTSLVKRPFILAGGLSPENAADAVHACHPYGLDVSSGIESGDFKDNDKMRAFVGAVRNADRSGRVVHPILPTWNEESEILILGSFPSVKSREMGYFYGHPQNRFWKVIAALWEEDVPMTVEERRNFLLRHHIAVWDVIGSCTITGSSDSSIRDVQVNDLRTILDRAPVRRIYVNGRKAEEMYKKYDEETLGRSAVCLPSTSPANAVFSLDRLIRCWSQIREDL